MVGVNKAVYPAAYTRDKTCLIRGFARAISRIAQCVSAGRFPDFGASQRDESGIDDIRVDLPEREDQGHWWYSNVPSFIEHDASARLEAVPSTKQVGYYSDMYKLEFALPKFRMYKRDLAKILAERFVINRGWSEDRALAPGRDVLRNNVDRIFFGKSA